MEAISPEADPEMARPRKVGLDYFSHDVTLSSDDKIEAIEAAFGSDGYAFYLKCLERIYRDGKAIEYPGVFRAIIAGKLKMSESRIDEIVQFAYKIRLLYPEIIQSGEVRTPENGLSMSEIIRLWSEIARPGSEIVHGIMSSGARKRLEFIGKERESDRNRNSDNIPPENGRVPSQSKEKEIKGKQSKDHDRDLFGDPGSILNPVFEAARKKYPGTKKGPIPEWENFLKKFGKRKAEILPLLTPSIQRYIAYWDWKSRNDGKKYFKHFQTWINGSCWTEEFPEFSGSGSQSKNSGASKPYDPSDI